MIATLKIIVIALNIFINQYNAVYPTDIAPMIAHSMNKAACMVQKDGMSCKAYCYSSYEFFDDDLEGVYAICGQYDAWKDTL